MSFLEIVLVQVGKFFNEGSWTMNQTNSWIKKCLSQLTTGSKDFSTDKTRKWIKKVQFVLKFTWAGAILNLRRIQISRLIYDNPKMNAHCIIEIHNGMYL